jgi:hypothetical protein
MSWTHALPTLKLLKAAQTYLLVSALRVTMARMELNVFHALLARKYQTACLYGVHGATECKKLIFEGGVGGGVVS